MQGIETERRAAGCQSRQQADVTLLAPGEGQALWVLGELITFKVRGEPGRGFTIFEDATQPGGGPPPHIHHTQDETIYVLEGSCSFILDGQTIPAGPGSFLHVPMGIPHTFQNTGTDILRTLASLTPSGDLERFFDEVGTIASDRSAPPEEASPPDLEAIVASARRNQFEIVAPPEG